MIDKLKEKFTGLKIKHKVLIQASGRIVSFGITIFGFITMFEPLSLLKATLSFISFYGGIIAYNKISESYDLNKRMYQREVGNRYYKLHKDDIDIGKKRANMNNLINLIYLSRVLFLMVCLIVIGMILMFNDSSIILIINTYGGYLVLGGVGYAVIVEYLDFCKEAIFEVISNCYECDRNIKEEKFKIVNKGLTNDEEKYKYKYVFKDSFSSKEFDVEMNEGKQLNESLSDYKMKNAKKKSKSNNKDVYKFK